jgi:hypothetical membrane protein
VDRIPWWAAASATGAPVFLGGGLALAQSRQPPDYNPVRDTISALAAHGAADRWVMTTALAGVGVCHLVTALGLRPATRVSRRILAVGGGATIVLALAFPQPAAGNSEAHTVAATVAFAALGTWPFFSARRQPVAPLLTRPVSGAASVIMLGLVVWFAVELHGGQRGLAERAAAGAQALWPLAVVVTTRRALAKHIPASQVRVRTTRR